MLAGAPLIQSGRVIALGVTTKTRAPGLPNVPTIAEMGLPNFEYEGWYAVLAPGKTPRSIIKLLANELHKIVDMPDVKQAIAGRGAAAKWAGPEALDKLVIINSPHPAIFARELSNYKSVPDFMRLVGNYFTW